MSTKNCRYYAPSPPASLLLKPKYAVISDSYTDDTKRYVFPTANFNCPMDKNDGGAGRSSFGTLSGFRSTKVYGVTIPEDLYVSGLVTFKFEAQSRGAGTENSNVGVVVRKKATGEFIGPTPLITGNELDSAGNVWTSFERTFTPDTPVVGGDEVWMVELLRLRTGHEIYVQKASIAFIGSPLANMPPATSAPVVTTTSAPATTTTSAPATTTTGAPVTTTSAPMTTQAPTAATVRPVFKGAPGGSTDGTPVAEEATPWIWIGLVVFLLLVLLGAGFYVYLQRGKRMAGVITPPVS